ncbi:galanin receptor 2b-like [Dysidea avara]|uniref:galanin receptor 2b-like n=1 Tax=Dysidea avara TaxID=196820 RepID=UPI0033283BBA
MNNSSDSEGCGLNDSLWNLDTEGFNQYIRPLVLFYEILVFIVAFSWNLFLIIFICRRKKMLKEPPNIFFVNLAIADFLATVVCMPFYIITIGAESWTFGDNDCVREGFCKAIAFFLSVFLLVSVYFLAAVAFDRFVAIVYNWQYKELITIKRAWIVVILCWIASLLVSSPPIYGFGIFFFEHRLGACLFRWSQNREYVLFFVIQLLIPITVITVCTLATYCRVRRFLKTQHQRTIRHLARQATVVFQEKHKRKQKKVLWIFTALLVILSLCWAPGILTAIIGFFIGYEKIPGLVFIFDLMFVLTNIMANPIVHAFFRKSIRKSLKKFIYSILEKMMVCFMFGQGKDFRDNVTNFLRESRQNANHNSSDNTTDPALSTYASRASLDVIEQDEGRNRSKPGIKRKRSIIEMEEMPVTRGEDSDEDVRQGQMASPSRIENDEEQRVSITESRLNGVAVH